MTTPAGRHFLQIPGPTNVPDRILRAIERPTIDHRGPEFGRLGERVLSGLREIFRTRGNVLIFPSSGTGAWEAALVNTLSPGDKVLMSETGHFSTLWTNMAHRLGLEVEILDGDWRTGADPERIEARLAEDRSHAIKAVAVVHNETSTGVTSRVGAVRAALDRRRPPGAAAGRHHLLARVHRLPPRRVGRRRDRRRLAEGADATAGTRIQRGEREGARGLEDGGDGALVLGLGGDARRERDRLLSVHAGDEPALRPRRGYRHAAGRGSGERRSGATTVTPRQPGARYARGGWRSGAGGPTSTRRRSPRYGCPRGTAPTRCGARSSRRSTCRSANGLGRLADRVFRIGHLGAFNDLMLAGTLSGIEMGLHLAGVPHRRGGVDAALACLAEAAARGAAVPVERPDEQGTGGDAGRRRSAAGVTAGTNRRDDVAATSARCGRAGATREAPRKQRDGIVPTPGPSTHPGTRGMRLRPVAAMTPFRPLHLPRRPALRR